LDLIAIRLIDNVNAYGSTWIVKEIMCQ